MTSYAMRLRASDRRGRHAIIWAVAPSPAAVHALIAAYRAESGFAEWEILQDAAPVRLDGSQLKAAGLEVDPGMSRLSCLMRAADAPTLSRTGP